MLGDSSILTHLDLGPTSMALDLNPEGESQAQWSQATSIKHMGQWTCFDIFMSRSLYFSSFFHSLVFQLIKILFPVEVFIFIKRY